MHKLSKVELLKNREAECLTMIDQIKSDALLDIEFVQQNKNDSSNDFKTLKEENSILKRVISDLKHEIELFKSTT